MRRYLVAQTGERICESCEKKIPRPNHVYRHPEHEKTFFCKPCFFEKFNFCDFCGELCHGDCKEVKSESEKEDDSIMKFLMKKRKQQRRSRPRYPVMKKASSGSDQDNDELKSLKRFLLSRYQD